MKGWNDGMGGWEERLIRQALLELNEEARRDGAPDAALEAEYSRTLSAVRRHIAQTANEPAPAPMRRARLRRGLRTALVAAAVLVVAFGGACLASPAIREQLFAHNWGTFTEVHVDRSAEEAQSAMTVSPDDPRLRYVDPDWCLHYYPLELPRAYHGFTSYSVGVMQSEDSERFWYLTDEYREQWLKADYQQMVFRDADMTGQMLIFEEDGRPAAKTLFDTKYNEVKRESIGGKDVIVSDQGSSIVFVWMEGDHLLKLSGSGMSRRDMEAIFCSVERIR